MSNINKKSNNIEQMKQYIEGQLPEKEIEDITTDLFQSYFDEEAQKAKWMELYNQDEDIIELKKQEKRQLNRQRLFRYSSIAASLLLLISGWFLFTHNSPPNYATITDSQLAEFQLDTPTRNTTAKVVTNSPEEQYHLGEKYLKQKKWQQAIHAFQKVIDHPRGYKKEEATWYAGLAAIKNEDFDFAKLQLKKVADRKRWKAKDAADLIKSLPE